MEGEQKSLWERPALLFFGSRPGDPTEGTFLGVGDAKNRQFYLWAEIKNENSAPPPLSSCFKPAKSLPFLSE